MPVAGRDGMSRSPNEDEHNCQFEQDDKVVKGGRLFNPNHQEES
jgi:hypothetical protein